MSHPKLLKILVALLVVGSFAYSTVAHPAYMNLFARDPRSMPDQRTNCAICHTPDGKASDRGFLTNFGRAFKENRFRISPQMRDRFTDIFAAADEPVTPGLGPDTLRFETAQVAIKVTVTNARGQYVTGLDPQAFQVLEDGREQELIQLDAGDSPLALAVLIDTSGSVLLSDLERWRGVVLDISSELRKDDVLAVYTFSGDNVDLRRAFSSERSDLKKAFSGIKAGGNGPIYDAVLQVTTDLRKRPERRRAVILLTDGSDSGSRATLRDTEQQTFLAGVSIYPVDLINTEKPARGSAERQAAAQTLERLAVESGGRYLTTPGGFSWTGNRGKVKRVLADLINELHSQYMIVYEPENGRRSGRWRTIQIRMEQSDLSARARLGYREGAQ